MIKRGLEPMTVPQFPILTARTTSEHAGKQTVLIISGGEAIDRRLMDALIVHPSYAFVLAARAHVHGGRLVSLPNGHDATKSSPNACLLEGFDYVVNCMAGSPQAILEVTRALCNAARHNPPSRIVHVSSMAVYGGACGLVDEEITPVPPFNTYVRARLEAEDCVRRYAADGGDAVIIRPSCIFGPECGAWTNRLARLLTARRLGDLGPAGDGPCNLIFVDDLVATLVATLSVPGISGETFNVSADWPTPTWNEFLVRFALAIGATPVERISARRLRMEMKIAAPLLRVMRLLARGKHAKEAVADAMTQSLVRLLAQDITINTAKAADRLGVVHTPYDQAMADTARWWTTQRAAAVAASFAPIGTARQTTGTGP